VRDVLAHLGEPTSPPPMAPARGPPLREIADAVAAPRSVAKRHPPGLVAQLKGHVQHRLNYAIFMLTDRWVHLPVSFSFG
jgi:hypothetical protein